MSGIDHYIVRRTQVAYVPLRHDAVPAVARKTYPLDEDALRSIADDIRRAWAVGHHYAPPMFWQPNREYFDNLLRGPGIIDLKIVREQLENYVRHHGAHIYSAVECRVNVLMDTLTVRVWF